MQLETLRPVRRLAILSDVHLGRGDGTTGFDGDSRRLCEILETVSSRADAVVINGDLYDLDRGALPMAQTLEYRTLKARWRAVEECMEAHEIRATAGNHDHALLGRRVGGSVLRAGYVVRVGDRRVRIEHGERFDAPIKRSRHVTSIFTWVSGVASRVGARPVYRALRAIEARATDDQSHGLERRAARWFCAHGNADILVIGHTHRRYARAIGRKWVFNPGQCMSAPPQVLVVDGERADASFAEIDETGGVRVVRRLALEMAIGNTEDIVTPSF